MVREAKARRPVPLAFAPHTLRPAEAIRSAERRWVQTAGPPRRVVAEHHPHQHGKADGQHGRPERNYHAPAGTVGKGVDDDGDTQRGTGSQDQAHQAPKRQKHYRLDEELPAAGMSRSVKNPPARSCRLRTTKNRR